MCSCAVATEVDTGIEHLVGDIVVDQVVPTDGIPEPGAVELLGKRSEAFGLGDFPLGRYLIHDRPAFPLRPEVAGDPTDGFATNIRPLIETERVMEMVNEWIAQWLHPTANLPDFMAAKLAAYCQESPDE